MIKIIATIFGDGGIGFIAYTIRDSLTGHMPRDWRDISDFTLGGVYILAPFLFMVSLLSEDEPGTDPPTPWIPNILLRVLTAFVFTGIGFIGGAVCGFRFFPKKNGPLKKNGNGVM
jgi:hypothetical protein